MVDTAGLRTVCCASGARLDYIDIPFTQDELCKIDNSLVSGTESGDTRMDLDISRITEKMGQAAAGFNGTFRPVG